MSTLPLAAFPSGGDEGYAAYVRVRDEVRRLAAAAPTAAGVAVPSHYWAEELSNIDYMIEASPLIIRKLRHHAVHITGLRPYDYRAHGDRQAFFERRLQALIALAGGSDLLVPEADALGGFGYVIAGRLYNVDTIKFFEVLVGMRRARLLDPFAASGERRLVCEIGAGWGGFSYQFKTLFPNTTYVIVDFPELFLFSATYLSSVFRQASIRFWQDGATFDRWEDADFIFVPHDRVDALHAIRPDLLVNLVSFQEMTAGQVESYVSLAASIGCASVYSFNRDQSRYNDEVDGVGGILSRQYDIREVRLLGSDYTKATKKESAVTLEDASRPGRIDARRYRHLAGTPRVAAQGRCESKDAPLVGIGVTLYNRAAYLPEALDSLLAQSHGNFTLLLVDDGSTDATGTIARSYAQRDARVRYIRHDERRGMVGAWRSAFAHAVSGGAAYFAWGSDHDRWHPEWLATLVDVLAKHPDVVLAYPLTQRIDPSGVPLAKPARQFDTFGISDLATRWKVFSRSDAVGAGDMVYGLMRVDAVESAGVFREVFCPDRLLIAELTLRGQIKQVPAVLWYRRQFTTGSVARQRGTLFAPGSRPPSALTPPWYMHARSLWVTYGVPVPPPLGLRRPEVRRLIVTYAAAYAWRHYGKTPAQRDVVSMLGRPRWILKRAKHGVLLGLHGALVAARYVGVTPLVERVCERITGRPRPWRGHA